MIVCNFHLGIGFDGIKMILQKLSKTGPYHTVHVPDIGRSACNVIHICHNYKNVHNFSLKLPAIFLPPSFSYSYSSCSFLLMLNFNPLLHY